MPSTLDRAMPGEPPRRGRRRSPGAGPRRRRSLPVLGGCLVASWVVPALLTAVRLDIVLLPLLLLAVASVIKVGGVLLDRLMAAGLITAGWVLVFGLLFSLWPWGLAPVATSGVLFSTVSVLGWAGRRRPRLPWRVRGSDLLVVGTAAAAGYLLYHPLAGLSAADRIGYFASAEDRLGHFSYFTAIQQVGGFNFLHQHAAQGYLMPPAEVVYPQGSHFLLAWLDTLVHSSAAPGAELAVMNRYFLYVLASYALLCAALVWGARWIGGPRLRGWRCTAVCAVISALVLAGSDVALLVHGFDSQIIGLLFLALTVALLVRPAMGSAEFLLVSVAGMVAVTYSYNIYAAIAGIVLVGTTVAHRKKFAKRRWLLYTGQAAGLGIAALPSLVSVFAKLDVASTSNMNGPSVGVDRTLLIGSALLALVAAVPRKSRRTAVGQAYLTMVLGTVAVVGAFAWWQLHTIGYYAYYFEKMAHGGIVVGLLALGSVGTLLRIPGQRRRTVFALLTNALVAVLTVAAAFTFFAGVQWGLLSTKNSPSAWSATALVKWSHGDYATDMGPRGVAALQPPPGTTGPVIVLYSNDSYKNLKATWIAELLNRRGGDLAALYETHWVNIGGPAGQESEYQNSMAHLKDAIAKVGAAPTILVADQGTGDRIRHDLAAVGVRATVVYEPQSLWTEPWDRTFPGDS